MPPMTAYSVKAARRDGSCHDSVSLAMTLGTAKKTALTSLFRYFQQEGGAQYQGYESLYESGILSSSS